MGGSGREKNKEVRVTEARDQRPEAEAETAIETRNRRETELS